MAGVLWRGEDWSGLAGRRQARIGFGNLMRINTDDLARLRNEVREAVEVHDALPDKDARFIGLAQQMIVVVHEAIEAYGYTEATVRWTPNPKQIKKMEIMMGQLAWLRREEGQHSIDRIFDWARGVPVWKISQREGVTDRTIQNRIDRSLIAMAEDGDKPQIETIEETQSQEPKHFSSKSPGPHGEVKIRKTYVAGIGFVKNGKRLRTAQETV